MKSAQTMHALNQKCSKHTSGWNTPRVVHATCACALAARVREGKRVSLVSIGVDAVSNAVLTIGNARLYLEENTLDVRAFPSFITVQKEGKQLNAVKFNIKVGVLGVFSPFLPVHCLCVAPGFPPHEHHLCSAGLLAHKHCLCSAQAVQCWLASSSALPLPCWLPCWLLCDAGACVSPAVPVMCLTLQTPLPMAVTV
eukprot:1155565-Pelagomonas_calceolata.AAC.2